MSATNGKDNGTAASENALKGLNVGFIGSGVMGEAMISGLINKGVLEPGQIMAADVLEDRGRELEKKYVIQWTMDNCEVARFSDLLVLSIKPQVLDEVLPQLNGPDGRTPKVVL